MSEQTSQTTSAPSTASGNDRIKMLRRRAKQRRGSVDAPSRDEFQKTQDEWFGKISGIAKKVHLILGITLSVLRTFFQKSILSVVAVLVLLVGMALACEAYAISAGVLPGGVIPKPGISFEASSQTILTIQQTFTGWDWFWLFCSCAIAITVQILQWASVRFIMARVKVGKSGGTLALKGFSLIVFAIFCGFLWWQDLSIISGLYLAAGFNLGGLLVWAWSCFPSELCESIFHLQKSLPAEE